MLNSSCAHSLTVPPPFPYEIWILILKHAITRPWNLDLFNPPIHDLDCVRGFAETSPSFKEMVRYFKDRTLVLTSSFPTIPISSDEKAFQARHLILRTALRQRIPLTTTVFIDRTENFRNMENFLQLTSLSWVCPGKPLLVVLDRLQKLPFSHTLCYLDLSGGLEDGPDFELSSLLEAGLSPMCFPKLLRLRISDDRGTVTESPDVSRLAFFLSGSQNLRLLSVHASLDDSTVLRQQLGIHWTSIEHLQPSEGYQRHISDCPYCTESYDHAAVIRRENAATRILAQRLPKLDEVRWAHAWVRSRIGEIGQRGTKIQRIGSNIHLLRDDGQTEH